MLRLQSATVSRPRVGVGAALYSVQSPASLPTFRNVYDEHIDSVWRRLRRLGVPDSAVADAAQEVFLVLHRRQHELDKQVDVGRWLLGVVVHVAQRQWRTHQRKARPLQGGVDDIDALADGRSISPAEQAERNDAVRVLYELLDGMDDKMRETFVLAELEQMTSPEIAELLGIPVNTASSRLRLARAEFERAVARQQARNREAP